MSVSKTAKHGVAGHSTCAAYALAIIAWGLVGGICSTVSASEVRESTITFKGNSYNYHFAVDVAAPLDAVMAVVTDYDNMRRINDDVVLSEVLERQDERRLKRRLWINHCLLVFCFDLYFVENIETLDDGTIRATVIPAESNFLNGESLWRIEAIDATTTRISVEAHQAPDFWIPPVIGPIVFKRAFAKEVRETGRKIEHEALRDARQ